MKVTQSFYRKLAGIALVLSLGISAYADTPREELAHAYRLLRDAKADYDGHRGKALAHLRHAGEALDLNLEGDAPKGERQYKSDESLAEARRLLGDVRDKLEARDKDKAADRVDKAIEEIDKALRVR
jgi:hypothetical protein